MINLLSIAIKLLLRNNSPYTVRQSKYLRCEVTAAKYQVSSIEIDSNPVFSVGHLAADLRAASVGGNEGEDAVEAVLAPTLIIFSSGFFEMLRLKSNSFNKYFNGSCGVALQCATV